MRIRVTQKLVVCTYIISVYCERSLQFENVKSAKSNNVPMRVTIETSPIYRTHSMKNVVHVAGIYGRDVRSFGSSNTYPEMIDTSDRTRRTVRSSYMRPNCNVPTVFECYFYVSMYYNLFFSTEYSMINILLL